MKQIYVCEKCGAQFDNWDDAARCEESHRSVEVIDWCHLGKETASNLLAEAYQYKRGQALPSVITVRYPVFDEESRYNKMDEHGHFLHEAAMYALVTPNANQKDLLAQINASMCQRNQEDYEESERWRKEWEAKQAAKAAQDSEASE